VHELTKAAAAADPDGLSGVIVQHVERLAGVVRACGSRAEGASWRGPGTPPHAPAWRLHGPRTLLRTPERRLRSVGGSPPPLEPASARAQVDEPRALLPRRCGRAPLMWHDAAVGMAEGGLARLLKTGAATPA
jgi:hypothetical protein